MIFLDLHKSCYAFDRDRLLDILDRYRVGPWACCILREYWERLWMVARVGGYYGAAFKEFRVVTQGDPLSPTIFNVVVYTLVRHWSSLVEEISGGQDRRVREGKHCSAYFYAGDGPVTSIDPEWLQGAFDTFTGLFGRFGMRMNVGKTVGVVYRPCWALGTQLEAVYKRRITGEWLTYW